MGGFSLHFHYTHMICQSFQRSFNPTKYQLIWVESLALLTGVYQLHFLNNQLLKSIFSIYRIENWWLYGKQSKITNNLGTQLLSFNPWFLTNNWIEKQRN